MKKWATFPDSQTKMQVCTYFAYINNLPRYVCNKFKFDCCIMGTYFSVKAKMAIKDPIKSVTSIVAQRVIQQCSSTCLHNMAIQVVEFQPREHKIQWPYDSE